MLLIKLRTETVEAYIRINMISSFYYSEKKDTTYVYIAGEEEPYACPGNYVEEIVAAIHGYYFIDGCRMKDGQVIIESSQPAVGSTSSMPDTKVGEVE